MRYNNCYVPSTTTFSNVYIREVIKEEIIAASDTLKGDSAYDIALSSGFVGSKAEWLNSIKGDKGNDGRDGSYVQKAYKTYAGMVADKDSIPTNTNVVVNNDPDKDKNAYYTYDGTEFTKSDFDPQGILTTVDVRLNQAVESASDYFQSQVADTIATSIDNSTVAYTDAINTTKAQVVADAMAATESALDTAVTSLFENGGLPATPFETKALMESSELVDGDYAVVTDDTDNNGLYLKSNDVWIKTTFYDTYYEYIDDAIVDRVSDEISNLSPCKVQEFEASKAALINKYNSDVDGFLFDIAQETGYQMMTIKDGIKSFETVDEFWSGVSKHPKLLRNKEGELRYTPHNLFPNTEDISKWGTKGSTVTIGRSLSRKEKPVLIKHTAASMYVYLGALNMSKDEFLTYSFVVGLVNTPFMFFRAYDTAAPVVIDLTNSTLIEKGEASNVTVTPLGNGFSKVVINTLIPVTKYGGIYISFNNTNNVADTKLGSGIFEQPQCNLGWLEQPYLVNDSDSALVKPTVGYIGDARHIFYTGHTSLVNDYSDDMTQPVWVKTGATVSLIGLSPVSTPCSRVVAASAEATVMQTVSGSTYLISAYVKPITLNGSVSLTVDNGVTWVDVSDKLNSGEFSEVFAISDSNLSNTTIGIKLTGIGTTVEVCYVNSNPSSSIGSVAPPRSVRGLKAANYGDGVFNKSVANNLTIKSSFYAGLSDKNSVQRRRYSPLELKGSGSNSFRVTVYGGVDLLARFVDSEGVVGEFKLAYADKYSYSNFSAIISNRKNLVETAYNSELTQNMVNNATPNLNSLEIGGGYAGSFGHKELIIYNSDDVVNNITDLLENRDNSDVIINTCNVTRDSQFIGTTMMREPTVCVLSDDGETVDFLVTHMNKREESYHVEAPARLIQRKIRYNKTSNKFTYLTDSQVLYEHEGFKDNLGHTQSAAVFKIERGINKGKLVCLFTKEEGSQTFAERNIYRMFNDSNGDVSGWTTPELVMASSTIGRNAILNSPDGSLIQLPSNHKTSPDRLVVAAYYVGGFYGMYSDDGGVTWSLGDLFTTDEVAGINETSICILPDGDILCSVRTNDTTYFKYMVKSSDGGQTWEALGILEGYQGNRISGSLIQFDPTGTKSITSSNGDVWLTASGDNSIGRRGMRLHKLGNDLTTVSETVELYDLQTYISYTAAEPILNNEYIVLVYEGGYSGHTKDNTSYLSIVKPPK